MNAIASRKEGWKVSLYFVAFFGMVALINAVFISLALETHSGVVVDNAYEHGLAYNAVLDNARKQEETGISDKTTYEDGNLSVRLQDADGSPIAGAQITATVVRPVQAGHDFEITFHETSGGTYVSNVTPPLPGRWKAHIRAEIEGTQHPYRAVHEFVAQRN